ncbi:TetR family transcriptional regulator [Mycolicibacterium mageritense DSM 44476 = CIP 104973]|uniref:TetR-family transcriptional regulator n=1 Tax=Mycolicibacterium mageritense TaxID=53462 RepID=A0ABM7HRG9_MYCME|nr:TetR/AcrR family transcriptional regulator [Mycolicibacterium mageritense]BBX33147.1 putative TetR-family transcriptional regulator [Mycolicibacterium mageritense]CDO21581.1 TetR family transcriptional regulator [Mycolicibacterium mageritense DSM 44476 = CIP 104973]
MSGSAGSYHHGHLREAAIEAAVAEVERVGAAVVSMREIARRAGVTHAALAYQFGDKSGLFTAVATEGFRLAAAAIGPAATGPEGFLTGGIAYVTFALTHPGHYEVMFRPDLYSDDDPDLIEARNAAFAILYGSARTSLAAPPEHDITGVVVAGWSLSHGLAALWRTGNLHGRISDDPTQLARQIAEGVIRLGELATRHLDTLNQARPATSTE